MINSKFKIHGIISLMLFSVSYIIGCFELARNSLILLFIETGFTLVALIVIGKGYCAKCECREKCNHILFGKVSLLTSQYKDEHYTIIDWVSVSLSIISIIIFPQFWLYKNQTMMMIYWAMLLAGGIDAVALGCAQCLNRKCSLCRYKES